MVKLLFSRLFQSTSPVRGTTGVSLEAGPELLISIHVPREGDDHICRLFVHGCANFNPRPP